MVRTLDHRATRTAGRLLGGALLTALLAAAWAGPDDPARNPAPTWWYVWFWVGLVPLTLLLGAGAWRRLDPLRPLAALAGRALPRRPLPERVSNRPALAGLSAFLWLELVYDHSASPRAVAVFVTGYALVQVLAGARYGPAWFERAEAFGAYTALIGAVSPLGRRADGTPVLRNPLDGLAGLPRSGATTRAVVLLLGSTAFDGLSRTPLWSDAVQGTGRAAYLLLGTAGLAGSVGAVALTYLLAVRLSLPYLRRSTGPYAEFGHTLVPVMLGYTVAHYFSFALFQGQVGMLLAGDPLGRGWDPFGLAGRRIDYLLLPAGGIALVQVGAIVAGHLVGVIAAHDRSVALMPRRYARTGQYPMLAVMIGYTTAGIALLAGA
ncbi:hypothetical protein [Kitasatospora terrestris]|uniref:Fenitrothion hydrolase n=1 Tax=Kitasatospora terrestris TaxID=258051 RepID=A0ABP9EGU8_9ACTN